MLNNITLKRIRPGTYFLIILIDGIESRRSSPITIQVVPAVISIFPSVSETLVAVMTIIIILILNTTYSNVYITILSFVLAGLELLVVQQSAKGFIFQTLSFSILSLLIVINGYMAISEIKNGDDSHFSNIRAKVYAKFTKQRLFPKNSDVPLVPSPASEVRRSLSNGNGNEDDKPKENYLIPFKKRSFKDKVISLFTPFSYEYDRNQIIEDAFYYPQRFITAILLGILTFAYFCYQVTTYFLSVISR